MKIIEELYSTYRSHLTGKKEDFEMLTFAFLEEMDRDSLLELIQEMNDQELYNLVGLYVMQFLKNKYKQEVVLSPIVPPDQDQLH